MRGRLTDALSVMLPSREQTAFLGACVLEGRALSEAWRAWQRSVGDPLRFLRGAGQELRGHLPLLYRNLTANGELIPADLQPYLRGALVREQLRFEAYEQCFMESVQVLAAARIDFTVLKGAAVSRTLFEPPFLRHCHDLDLWVREEDRPRALGALVSHGFREGVERAGTTPVEHSKGLPILLHTQLLRAPLYRLPSEEMRDRRRLVQTPSGSWKVLAQADMLLHCCGHASTVGRRPHANWVVDAHRLTAQLAADDWERFLDVARRADLALPLFVLLRYLREELAASVPLAVIDGLAHAADRAESATVVAAIDGAWLGRPGGLGAMFGKSSWRSRVTLARWLLLPPASYVRSTRGPMGPACLTVEYLARPVRFLVRSVRQRIRHASAGDRPAAISPAVVVGGGSE